LTPVGAIIDPSGRIKEVRFGELADFVGQHAATGGTKLQIIRGNGWAFGHLCLEFLIASTNCEEF
jgi:hypothetical protein